MHVHSSSSDAFVDYEAEQMLVVSLLLNPELLPTLSVRSGHFTSARHRRCFDALRARIRAGEAVDIVTLVRDIGAEGAEVDEIASWLDNVPLKGSAPGYERRLLRAASRREAAKGAERLGLTLADRLSSAAEVAELAEGVAAAVAESHSGGVKTAADLMDGYCSWLMGRGSRQVTTGWRLFDTHANLRPGELMVLTARTGVGKSAIAQALTMQVAERHPDSFQLYLSLEMPEESCWERMAQIRYGWTRHKVEDVHTGAAEGEGLLAQLMVELRNVLFGFDAPVTLGDITRTVRNVRSQHEVLLVVIDHADYIQLPGGKDAKAEKLRDLYAGLKTMAKAEGVAVLVLAQTARDRGGDGDQALTLDAVRSSAGAEESADFLLGAWRPKKSDELDTEPLVIKVLKGRRCEGVAQEFRFTGRHLRIEQEEL